MGLNLVIYRRTLNTAIIKQSPNSEKHKKLAWNLPYSRYRRLPHSPNGVPPPI